MTGHPYVLIIVIIFIIFLTGCTGKREINDLAIVMAVGIDQVEEESEKKIEVTIETVRPADARGQTGAPAGNTGDPIWSASARGKTLFEAIRNLTSISTRRIFWAHNFIIVVNEDVAKDGIKDIIDFFTRNSELRMRTWIAITPDKAKEVISPMTGLEIIPGEALDKLFRYTDISGDAPKTELLDVQAAYLGDTTHPMIARMRLIDRGVSNKKQGQANAIKQVSLEGAGVFKDDRLIGLLDKNEARIAILFTEKLKTETLVLTCPKKQDGFLSAEIIENKFRVTPSYENGEPAFDINYEVTTNIVEAACPFSTEDQQLVQLLEKEIESKLQAEIENLLQKAQKEYKLDFLELGQRFNNKFPREWKEIQSNWDTIFSNVNFQISVDATVKSGVLLYNPTQSGK